MLVPVTTLKNSILKFHKEFQLYPLWLCPMRLLSPPTDMFKNSQPAFLDTPVVRRLPADDVNAEAEYELACPVPGGMVNPTPSEQLYVDIGAYGIPQAPQWATAVKELYKRDLPPVSPADKADCDLQALPDDVDEDPYEELHVRVMKRVEKWVRDNHGYQALYAECFQSRPEFREMFDHRLYERLRKELGCEGRLPEVYDKVCRSARK
jgi:delta24-sterol reductase